MSCTSGAGSGNQAVGVMARRLIDPVRRFVGPQNALYGVLDQKQIPIAYQAHGAEGDLLVLVLLLLHLPHQLPVLLALGFARRIKPAVPTRDGTTDGFPSSTSLRRNIPGIGNGDYARPAWVFPAPWRSSL